MARAIWSQGLSTLLIASLALLGCENGGNGTADNGCPEWCAWEEDCEPASFPGMSQCVSSCNNYLDTMAAQCEPGCDDAETDIMLCRGSLACGTDPFTACAAEFDHYNNLCCAGGVCCDERI